MNKEEIVRRLKIISNACCKASMQSGVNNLITDLTMTEKGFLSQDTIQRITFETIKQRGKK